SREGQDQLCWTTIRNGRSRPIEQLRLFSPRSLFFTFPFTSPLLRMLPIVCVVDTSYQNFGLREESTDTTEISSTYCNWEESTICHPCLSVMLSLPRGKMERLNVEGF